MKLILGSGSPRRKELLAGLGFEFEVRTKDTDESFSNEMSVEEVPTYLAKKKALALLPDLKENELVISADTVVILNNEILGKPESKEQAIEMLKRLSNQQHTVITGVCFLNNQIERVFSDRTEVTFGELSSEEIEHYIDTHKPYDKAGSYGVQEWLGYAKVSHMNGTYTNVMGFPTNKVYAVLKEILS